MNADTTQENRSIAIQTPLGDDTLLLTRFCYTEALNEPFNIFAELQSKQPSINFDQLVGNPVTISMDMPGGSTKRYFHGIVADFEEKEKTGDKFAYEAVIVPWIAHLRNASDCKIHTGLPSEDINKLNPDSIPYIVCKALRDAGFTDIEPSLTGKYSSLEYCVQYRETTLNFISRLLEKAGICYYFRHEKGRHVLVLTDSVDRHVACPGYNTIQYHESVKAGSVEEFISNWRCARRAQTGKFTHTDFDFTRPNVSLQTETTVPRSNGLANFERFDYPGEYVEENQGQEFADARIGAIQSGYEVVNGWASCRGLAAGCTFKLDGHPRPDQNRAYLLTRVSLQFSAGYFASGGENGADQGNGTFFCTFSAIPTTQQYRPARISPKPLVFGPQTAIVTGSANEEIYTDKYGRVKVQFHWDRYGKSDENSSCWIRVSQLWAGKGWGAMHLPRIGQEVIVEFLEGDPDRPIITGRVYNGDQKPPYDPSANKNISTIKSNSTKGGGGFNEVKMDDTKGKEMLSIQAEKDRTVLVKNNNSESVNGDESISVGHDQTSDIKNNKAITVGGTHTETIKGDTKITITEGTLDHDVAAGEAHYHVKGLVRENFEFDRVTDVTGMVKETIGHEQVTEVTRHIIVTSTGAHVHITAATEIQLQVGASLLLMKSDGSIELSGNNIAINGAEAVRIKGGEVATEADTNLDLKGAVVVLDGSATNTVKGGMVMLNP